MARCPMPRLRGLARLSNETRSEHRAFLAMIAIAAIGILLTIAALAVSSWIA